MAHIGRFRQRSVALGALLAIGALTLSACASESTGDSSDPAGQGDSAASYRIAVLSNSASNGFDAAIIEGVKKYADEAGNVEVTVFDANFSQDEQFAQMQNAATSGRFDGVVAVPADGVALGGAFPLATDLPVVSLINPIGPDIMVVEPQVENVITTFAHPPAVPATKQAELVVEHCKDIDPCKVIMMVGFLSTALDVERVRAAEEVYSKYPNIQMFPIEGLWAREDALTAVSNVLQVHPDISALTSAGDQMTHGADIAFESAGIDASKIFITSQGGTVEGVEKLRSGEWDSIYLYFPVTLGYEATKTLVEYNEGKSVPTVKDPDFRPDGLGAWATPETVKNFPDFVGEWNG